MNTERLAGLLEKATKTPWVRANLASVTYKIEAGAEYKTFRPYDDILAAEAVNALPTLLSRLAALEEALKPFADVAEGEVYAMFAAESKSTFRLTNGNATRTLTFINAECFDRARATLAQAVAGEKL